MSFAASFQSEILKTRRTASFWLTTIGAALVPFIILLVYVFNAKEMLAEMPPDIWTGHLKMGWQVSNLLFPMYIILICTLIPQIEFKNNTWKQVFASPQSTTQIYLSKFLTVHLVIILCLIFFNLFMLLSAVLASLINPAYPFFKSKINWSWQAQMTAKAYLPILGFSAIQFWLSLRFKNFIAPVGIGLACIIGGIIASNFGWKHIAKLPYAYPLLSFQSMGRGKSFSILNHELNSIGYLITFMVIACFDLAFRKSKG